MACQKKQSPAARSIGGDYRAMLTSAPFAWFCSLLKLLGPMTDRLYYRDSFLYEFDGKVVEILRPIRERVSHRHCSESRCVIRPAGQVHDVGIILTAAGTKIIVSEVADLDDGRVVHFVESPAPLEKGASLHGSVTCCGGAITSSSTPGSMCCQQRSLVLSSSYRVVSYGTSVMFDRFGCGVHHS